MQINWNKTRKRKPKDETKDHLNFLQHQAGLDSQLEMDTSSYGDPYDSQVTSWYGDGWRVSKPSGRLPFNANLLTVAQVKFHPKEMAKRVVRKLKEVISTRNPAGNDGYNVPHFDTIYNMLDNRRCAKLASLHFNRPKIWKEHLKDVKKQDVASFKRSFYNLKLVTSEAKEYDIQLGWFRKYLYGNTTLREIRDPVVEDLCRRHKDLIARLRDTTNATATLLGALEIAVEFQLHEQATLDDAPAGQVTTHTAMVEDQDGKIAESKTRENIEDVKDEIIEQVKDEVVNENAKDSEVERATAGIGDAPKDFEGAVEDNLKNQDKINGANRSIQSDKCVAELYETGETEPFTPTIPIQSIELEGALDRGANALGNSGHRVSRRAWRLPLLGDARVFHKYPQTATEMVVLVDMSSSMGSHKHDYYPMHAAMNTLSAVQSRFPDTKAYGFTASRRYIDEVGNHSILIPITKGTIPSVIKSATPLCGAMKKLSQIIDLESSKVLVITDGKPNVCMNRDADNCCRTQAQQWLEQGVRFATMYIGRDGRDHPLPVDLAVDVHNPRELSTTDIINVLSFFKG